MESLDPVSMKRPFMLVYHAVLKSIICLECVKSTHSSMQSEFWRIIWLWFIFFEDMNSC